MYNFDEKTLNSSKLITILQLSDFHYDPYYEPGSSSRCIESICCRNSSGVSLNILYQRTSNQLNQTVSQIIAKTEFNAKSRILG